MNCPACGIELRIGPTVTHTDEHGEPETVQTLVCPNPQCVYNRARAPVGVIRHTFPRAENAVDEANKMCHDRLLARITDTEYFVAPGVSFTLNGDSLSVTCPVCNAAHVYDVAGLTELTNSIEED